MHFDPHHVSGGHHHHHDHDHHHHDHEHCHHDHDHDHCHHDHDHDHEHCGCCGGHCEHTPLEELQALIQYMVNHNGAHARELAQLAEQLKATGNTAAYEQVLSAVSDFEKGNMRLSMVLFSLNG